MKLRTVLCGWKVPPWSVTHAVLLHALHFVDQSLAKARLIFKCQ